jgi:hypothetical protein
LSRALSSFDFSSSVKYSFASLTDGTFRIDSALYELGSKVTVSFDGYVKDDGVSLMDNPIDIIEDLLGSKDEKTNNPFLKEAKEKIQLLKVTTTQKTE